MQSAGRSSVPLLLRSAIVYLLRLGAGWIIGMGACVLVLSKLFSAHIVQSDDRKEGGNMSPD